MNAPPAFSPAAEKSSSAFAGLALPAICLLAAALLLFLPLRTGDLTGYDDALYADMAKSMVRSGDWTHLRTNGEIAIEHPPLLVWMQAALFTILPINDAVARLPGAICGLGTLALTYLLGRRLLNESAGSLALFAMLTSAYFLKYAARGMTDVPFLFFFLAAVYCWVRAREDHRWLLLAGIATGLTQMTRALMGLALPLTFLVDLLLTRRRIPLRFAVGFVLLAFTPVIAWYSRQAALSTDLFMHSQLPFLNSAVYGEMTPWWRKYTGAPEYIWMLAKSYWPWFPFALVGMIQIARRRDRRLWILLSWPAAVFLLCAAAKSRVLRYMLPAYPAFALWTAVALQSLIREKYLRRALPLLAGLVTILYAYFGFFPKTHWEASVTRPLALRLAGLTPVHERIAFYDGGVPRFDEINQLHWYGDRDLSLLTSPSDLLKEIDSNNSATTFVVDQPTYRDLIQPKHLPVVVVYRRGHLLCLQRARSQP